MRGFILTCALMAVGWSAIAQNSMGGGDYEWLVIHKADLLEGNSDTGLKSIDKASTKTRKNVWQCAGRLITTAI